jgi:outer membrane protein OmpA-like peptidoglycan-associated protein
MSPFIHAGNSYLVFASDGRVGMGGYDLYKMEKNKQNQWTKPENLGYPINTHGDEIGLVINARGDKAYFSSNRVAKNGRDIFSFDLPKELQPPTTSWLKGKVFDAETKKRLWASLLLIDLERKDTIAQLKSDRVNGNYLLCLPSGREYMFAAEADGYLFYSNHFSMLGDKKKTDPQVLDIPLYALKKGSEINLRNIFFAVDSWELLPQSELELQRLTRLLSVNSTLIVEIGGHTDSTGDDAHNLNLSNNRAKAVCDYLIKNGIAKKRLTYKGYGENKPIADNESEKGKALNRRTGFKILDH